MHCLGDKMEKFRRVPNPYFAMHITSKFLFGMGLGVLLATWLPVWTGWVFIALAFLIAIPSVRIVLGGKKQ